MNTHWKIFTNSSTEEKAKKVFNAFSKTIAIQCGNLIIEPYHKGGYTCSCTIKLKATEWPEATLEALTKAQSVGRSWVLTGNIETELDAWSNEPCISGIQNIQLALIKNA